MLYSIATVCLSGTLKDKIPAIANAGFKGIELFENDLIQHNGSVAEVRRMLDDHGLKLVTYQPFRDFEGLPEPYRSRAMERAKHKLDLTAGLGSDLLMVCSSCAPQALAGVERAAEDFRLLGDLAAERGLRVAYEALAWGKHIHDYRDSWEIVRRANHPAVGLCLDTFHIFSRETELNTLETIPEHKIFLVQVADAPRLSMDHLSWSRHYRCFPGQGELPLKAFMQRLDSTRYNGPLSLEIFNDQFRAGSTESNAEDGYRSLVYLCNQRDDQAATKPLPTAQQPGNLAFLEFALAPEDRDDFTHVISTLGFEKAGTHRSKAVEYWQQADIHFVLNHQNDSFASDFRQQHAGTSVCSIALEVEDNTAVVQRSEALNYPTHFGDPKQDTEGNPSIHGLAESQIIFVERDTSPSIWQRDFIADESYQSKAYLQRIDRLSITMNYGEMLQSLLLFRSLFGMRALPSVDVFDPGGLVHSQVMCSENNRVCLALNSTQAERTVANKLMQRQVKGGVQHIALSCHDIFATANRLKAGGITTVKMPKNYYADLVARFLLSESKIESMAELGILYDEDEHGSFYQVYTAHFHGRFCFEIVQRNGYKGFGANNTPVRSAMQAIELG